MDFLTLAKQRCTVRLFEDRPLEKEKLDYILEVGRLAPTACNKQPQRILVLQKRENIEKVQKAYSTFGARCVMIIGRDTRESLIRPYDGKCSGDLDIGIVTSQMMLAAREKEIGSVMVGLFDPRIIREEFHTGLCRADSATHFGISEEWLSGYEKPRNIAKTFERNGNAGGVLPFIIFSRRIMAVSLDRPDIVS